MTTIYCEQNKNRYSILADGHAAGSPEVCAAVSGLIYALSGYLLNAPRPQTLENSLSPGHALLRWKGGREAKAVFELCVIGFLQIEAAHSEYISVKRIKK